MIKMRIVVGVDGSAGSIAAVAWAADQARRRDAELRVLTAYHRQLPLPYSASGRRPDQEAADVVHAAVRQARSIASDIDVRGIALPGYAAPVLLHAAEEAALLVVGDRGGGRLPGLSAGSVSNQVATHAKRSVAVVRGRPETATGPVVAAVGDDPAADTILGWAFEEAALRGAEVLAVTARATRDRRPSRATAEEALGTDLDSRLDPWRRKYPGITARREVVAGRPERVLVQSCRQAQLAVVGPRRHGYEGVLLGSIGTRLLQRADCPVLVARA